MKTLPVLLLSILLVGCSMSRNESTAEKTNTAQPANTAATTNSAEPATNSGAIKPGTASGSYTAKGETVQLHYAYAGRGKRFGSDSVIVLVTDQPIPSDALAAELDSQKLLLDEKIRGLEYVFSEDGFWVRFHPGQYQESKSGTIKEYAVANGTVTGFDEDKGDMTDGKYARSVRFVAPLP